MALPLLVTVVVLGVEIRDVARDSSAVRRQTALAVSADGPSRLLISLQDEQAWATVEVIGLDSLTDLLVEGYDATRQHTDTALAGFERLLEDGPEATRRAFAPALENLDADLAEVRREVDADDSPRTLANLPLSEEVFDRYTRLVEPFLAGIDQVASALERGDLRQGAELIDLTGRQVNTLGRLVREVGFAALFTGGVDRRDDVVTVSALRGRFVRLAGAIRERSTGPYAAAGDDRLLVDYVDAVVRLADGAVEGTFDGEEFVATVAAPPDESYQAYRERVATILRDRAADIGDAAARRERAYIALIVLTGCLAIGAVVVVARSITRPLRSLADQVRHVAHGGVHRAVQEVLGTPLGEDVQMPRLQEITVAADDEVGALVTVMNTVQHSVVALAVNQAVLRRHLADSFVSLGRRNQDLLGRQMGLIDEIQRAERDPHALLQLFHLDHLATRMRRNAESLLVLGGDESPRASLEPVGVVDVVRAALREVEHFPRVDLVVIEPYTIVGHAAPDLGHLLAELLENALLYSPPDERVLVHGTRHAAGYTVAVVDAGLGMPPPEIARANRRLAGGESFTVAPSKYLGLYVAGNLATRHGIRVQLHPSTGPGVTAVVHLPPTLSPV